MGTYMKNNQGSGSGVVTVVVEEDDGIFLAISCDELGIDLYSDRPDEIEQFFSEVEQAKANFARLKEASG